MRKVKNWFKENYPLLAFLSACIVFIAIIIIATFTCVNQVMKNHNKSVAELYNDGICPNDNTHYELRGIDDDLYIYVCPECYGEVGIYK